MAPPQQQLSDTAVEMTDAIEVQSPAAPVAAIVGRAVVSAGIATGTALWANWARIAIRGEDAAWKGRAELERQKAAGLPFDAANDELEGAMLAVSGASFAIDGFYGTVAPWITVPPLLVSTWSANMTPREGRIVESLKLGYKLGAAGIRWRTDLPWLCDLRTTTSTTTRPSARRSRIR